MELKDLVPPLELCKQIPEGEFSDSALVWVYDGESWWVNAREFDATPEIEYPAPTLQEIMENLNIDGICIEYRDSSPHWVVASPYTDKTPAGDNPAAAALKLWMEARGK